MKKIIFALLCAVLFSSCENNKLNEYKVVVIDSCEYIQFETYNEYKAITHKGNCKYCDKRINNKQK